MTGRTGLLGGTFDPPHSAHLAMARKARDVLGLERVLLVPAPMPPHKQGEQLSPYADRAAMASLAVAGARRIEVSRIEEDSEGISYTVELLERCRARFGKDLYFIVGADSLRDLPSWRSPGEILDLCTLVVFPRDDLPMVCAVPGEVSLVVFESPTIDLASTGVRERVAAGQPIDGLVADGVADYIRNHGLYS